jgi:cardiolipin synthase
MEILGQVLLGLLGLAVLLLAAIGLLYVTRGTPLDRVQSLGGPDGPPAIDDPRFRELMELHVKTVLVPGHRASVAINGDQTYPRLWADLRAAKETITLQMYYFQPGRMADEFQKILIAKVGEGVRVLLLHDAFGSAKLSKEYVRALEDAGVEVATFRPVRWYEIHKAQQRSHIRIVVIDGRIAWTGGFGIDDKWYGDGRHDEQWRDTNVRFEGPTVLRHQATFAAGWAEATGELLTGDDLFPHDVGEPVGDMVAGLLHAAPTLGSTAAERFLALTISAAQRTLYVTNAYFVPDDSFIEMLAQAAERGVDVRILTSGEKGDVKSTWLAGRARYEKLLSRGVKIYEYRPTMVHSKTIVADGRWTSIGTLNFDNRSLVFNDETLFLMLDEGMGADMEQIFREDLPFADEIRLEEFSRRPWHARLKEQLATRVSRLL